MLFCIPNPDPTSKSKSRSRSKSRSKKMPYLGLNTTSPPAPTTRTLHIRELTASYPSTWTISLTSGTYHQTHTLQSPFSSTQESRLRWSLEDHPHTHPFSTTQPRLAAAELAQYVLHLHTQLQLHDVFSYAYPEDAGGGAAVSRWYIDVEGGAGLQGLHWEVLERGVRQGPRVVVVRRRVLVVDPLRSLLAPVRAAVLRVLLISSGGGGGGGRMANLREIAACCGRGAGVEVEVVRPGTWRALQEHLGKRGRGWFQMVHLDAHVRVSAAREGGGTAALSFLAEESSRRRSWREAEEVAALMGVYGVQYVMLNAARSAVALGSCMQNVAEMFVRDGGVRVVVAFPYKMVCGGTQVFMRAFYGALLGGRSGCDVAGAVAEARREMMRVRVREAKFGIKVVIEDWLVPVLYHSGAAEVALRSGVENTSPTTQPSPPPGGRLFAKFYGLLHPEKPPSPQRQSLISAGTLGTAPLVGRDGDIAKLEAMLRTSVLRMSGPPGVGKSTLALHLCWWWKTTRLVQDHFYFDWHEMPHLNVEMITRRLYLALFPLGSESSGGGGGTVKSVRGRLPWPRSRSPSPTAPEIFPPDWAQRTVSRLRETPFLVVLDSLESSDASVKHNEQLKGEINEFLEHLQGGRTIVLVLSNRRECWLNDTVVRFGSYRLKSLELGAAVELAGGVMDRCRGDRLRFRGAEGQRYMRKLMKLAEMNPLVMDLTLRHVTTTLDQASPQAIFLSLLQGSIPLSSAGGAHDAKALCNVASLYDRLDRDSKQLLLCLAPFWSRLPKDIDPYIHSLLYYQALPSTAELVRQLSISRKPSNWERQRAKSIISSTGLLLRYNYIIRDLLSLELLTETDPPQQNYRIHPLLTLFLRQLVQGERDSPSPTIITDYGAVTCAFLDYYTQRAAHWAEDPDPASYQVAAAEMREEETNFLSALYIPLQSASAEKVFETFPLHAYSRLAAMALVDKELKSSVSLIAHFSTTLLQRFSELRTVQPPALEAALCASNWLCEYHADASPISLFQAQVSQSTSLISQLPADLGPLSALEEQAAWQTAAAVSDGMIDGLRLRKPWSGLLISHVSRGPNAHWDSDATWARYAMTFSRLRSLAAQAPLSTLFSAGLSAQLRTDLLALWDDCARAAAGTPIAAFLLTQTWVRPLLINTPSPPSRHIPSTTFLGYAEYLRSQLLLQHRDTASAKRYLSTGLQRARFRGVHAAKVLLHTRLCELTFELRHWPECIAYGAQLRAQLGELRDDGLAPDDAKAHADVTWRVAMCHVYLRQWEAAAECFTEALGVARHGRDAGVEYAVLRKLAAVKRESGVGELTVAEALLKALVIAYDCGGGGRGFERGVLLQRVLAAMVRGKAGESERCVLARLAEVAETSVREMAEFVEELLRREKEVVVEDGREGVAVFRTERMVKALYSEAESIVFEGVGVDETGVGPRGIFFIGTKWEAGLLRRRDSL